MFRVGTKLITFFMEILIGFFIAIMVLFALFASLHPIAFVYQGY